MTEYGKVGEALLFFWIKCQTSVRADGLLLYLQRAAKSDPNT